MLFYCFFVENGGAHEAMAAAEGVAVGRSRRQWQGVQCENHVVARGSMLLVRQIFHFITYFPIPVFVDLLKNISRSTKFYIRRILLHPSYQAVSKFSFESSIKSQNKV